MERWNSLYFFLIPFTIGAGWEEKGEESPRWTDSTPFFFIIPSYGSNTTVVILSLPWIVVWFVCSSVVIELRKQLFEIAVRKKGKMIASDIIPGLAFAFDRALAADDLIFLPSTVHKHTECGVEV